MFLTHIFISFGMTCFTHLAFYVPLTYSIESMFGTLSVWSVIIPTIMLATKALDANILDSDKFAIIKFVSVDITLLTIQSFIAYNFYFDIVPYDVLNYTLNSLFAVNIAEACVTQAMKKDDIFINRLNTILGVGLIAYVIYSSIENGMDIYNLRLVSGYNSYFVVSYTLWNTLFKIQMGKHSTFPMFFMVSLGLPLIAHFSDLGDWLQFRAVGLLSYIIYTLGITPLYGRIFPFYNKDNYMEDTVLSKFQNYIRYPLLVSGYITLIVSFFT